MSKQTFQAPPDDTPSSATLKLAIGFAGTQQKLADMAGVSQNAITSALSYRRVSAELAVALELGTAGRFKRWQFRPDLWDAPIEAAE